MTEAKPQIVEEIARLLDQQRHIHKLLDEIVDIIEFRTAYLRWDTQSLKIVQTLAPEKYDRFVDFFESNSNRKLLDASIEEYVRTMGTGKNGFTEELPFDPEEQSRLRFLEHLKVLDELSFRIESVLADIEGHLFADLMEKELEAAKVLKPISLRAAGTLAGVVLERHLRKVALKHNVTIPKPETTLRDLNDPLKLGKVYDFDTWRKIQQLGDLYHICSHQRSRDPKSDEVEDLIEGVYSVLKSVA
ncbi:MAG TPA: hypothetical protein VMB80_11845 [Candidatus Acidoferrum sp.]|nr:hypothetical protein [Candidatus Acidoferrum sp.]